MSAFKFGLFYTAKTANDLLPNYSHHLNIESKYWLLIMAESWVGIRN